MLQYKYIPDSLFCIYCFCSFLIKQRNINHYSNNNTTTTTTTTANTANTPFHTRIHTFNIVSLLLALMADLCLPLCAGEDTFELHSVQLELEAVERWIHELLGKQAQLRKWKATPETSRADAHKSGVSMQRAANSPTTSTPCVSLHRPRAPGTRSSQMAFTPAPGNHGPWVQQRKTRSRPRRRLLPLRSSTSHPGTASPLSARLIITLWSSETQSSGMSVLC